LNHWSVNAEIRKEEDARNYQLQLEREERERQQQLEQARIDRLLDEAATLRRAIDIRACVDAVNAVVRGDSSISSDAIERCSKWVLAEADRIDPVKTARFLEGIETDDNAIEHGVECGGVRDAIKITLYIQCLIDVTGGRGVRSRLVPCAITGYQNPIFFRLNLYLPIVTGYHPCS